MLLDCKFVVSDVFTFCAAKYSGDKTYQADLAAGTVEEWAADGAHTLYNKVGSAKDASYNAARHAHDTTADTLQSAKDDTSDAAEHAKDKSYDVKEIEHDSVASAKHLNDKISDDAGSAGDTMVENVQLGVDKSKGSAIEAAKKMIHSDGRAAGANSGDSAKETVRDRTRWLNHEGRDPTGENYDSAWDMVGGYYDEAGRRYVSARDYYKFTQRLLSHWNEWQATFQKRSFSVF